MNPSPSRADSHNDTALEGQTIAAVSYQDTSSQTSSSNSGLQTIVTPKLHTRFQKLNSQNPQKSPIYTLVVIVSLATQWVSWHLTKYAVRYSRTIPTHTFRCGGEALGTRPASMRLALLRNKVSPNRALLRNKVSPNRVLSQTVT